MHRRIVAGLVGTLTALVFPGCAHLGEQVADAPAVAGAPDAARVLADLARNDEGIENFRAAGSFTLDSPEVEGIQRFKGGSVAFRQPGDLRVVGRFRRAMVDVIAFRLTCVGDEFLVEFPTIREPGERYYYRLEGESFDSVPFSVSPSDIARELFFPERWSSLRPRHVRLLEWNADTTTATLEVGPKKHPRRRIAVALLDGPQWAVIRSERLGDAGEVIALALRDRDSYRRNDDGFYFPTHMEVAFPNEHTTMTFDLRNIRTNTDLVNDSLFAFNWRPPVRNEQPVHETETERKESPGNRGRFGP